MLACFFEDEIEAMLCGAGESWTVEALAETIKFDHGYTAQSTAISYFLQAGDLTFATLHRTMPLLPLLQLCTKWHHTVHVLLQLWECCSHLLPVCGHEVLGAECYTARVHVHLVAS